MTRSHWLLLFFSAFLYAAPLLWSSYCWPLAFVFPIPLLYIAVYNNLSWIHGLAWGIVAMGCHLSGVIMGLDNIAQGSLIARFAPALVMILTSSLYAVLWFALSFILIRLFSLWTIGQLLTLWVVTYTLFLMGMEHYSLTVFGRLEGYFLLNPLLVLAEQPQLLTLLTYLGKSILTLLLISFSGSLVYWFIYKTTRSFVWVLIFAAPWLISLAIPLPTIQKPTWLKNIAYVPVKISSQINLTKQASIAQKFFYGAALLNPEAKLILMPESSIFCDNLSDTPELCAMWSEKDLMRPLHIILGSFRWDGPFYRNSMLWFFNGNLEKIFDKRHAMLMTEALPELFSFKIFKNLFFRSHPGITPSTNERPSLHVLEGVSFIPYICSELFFNDKPDDSHAKGSTILAMTNDIWCMNSNIPKLMCLAARFRAIQWQRNVLYISYFYGKYFDTSGNQIDLITEPS